MVRLIYENDATLYNTKKRKPEQKGISWRILLLFFLEIYFESQINH